MSWIALVGSVLKLLTLLFTNMFEGNAKKRKRKEAYLQKAKEGIKAKDRSSVTAYFDACNRV